MGMYYSLTTRGEGTRKRLERKCKGADVLDQEFVLLEVGREQPAEEERFIHHMQELGFDEGVVQEHLWELVETGEIE